MQFYTGVGSRKTPQNVLSLITHLAQVLYRLGYILRSGGAVGADTAFAVGAREKSVIYYARHSTPSSEVIAKKFHPAWHRCSSYARKLHGRNSFQVLGDNLDSPSSFLVCWTPDGCIRHSDRTIRTGGTGTAISIADHYHLRIFNLRRRDHFDYISSYVDSH